MQITVKIVMKIAMKMEMTLIVFKQIFNETARNAVNRSRQIKLNQILNKKVVSKPLVMFNC